VTSAQRLEGACGSVTQDGGIALYGSADSLRSLATTIGAGMPVDIRLPAPPDEVLEKEPLALIRVVGGDAGPIELRANGEMLEIVGGAAARAKLAASLENLASSAAFGGEVPSHVDLEYFPGHSFLGPESTWMTVTLLPVLSQSDEPGPSPDSAATTP
jgi:hypothetical protein